MTRQLIELTAQQAEARMLENAGGGHGWDHVQRVVRLAKYVQSHEGGDLLVIELAALLHDVGDAKFQQGVERSGEFSQEILTRLGAKESVTRSVAKIVDQISFRKNIPSSQLSQEAKVVQDADRLDALGAVGIVRTIEYGASIGQPFYISATDDRPSGVQHFYNKLFRLKDLMNTSTARQLAVERESVMRDFLDQFLAEVTFGE